MLVPRTDMHTQVATRHLCLVAKVVKEFGFGGLICFCLCCPLPPLTVNLKVSVYEPALKHEHSTIRPP